MKYRIFGQPDDISHREQGHLRLGEHLHQLLQIYYLLFILQFDLNRYKNMTGLEKVCCSNHQNDPFPLRIH